MEGILRNVRRLDAMSHRRAHSNASHHHHQRRRNPVREVPESDEPEYFRIGRQTVSARGLWQIPISDEYEKPATLNTLEVGIAADYLAAFGEVLAILVMPLVIGLLQMASQRRSPCWGPLFASMGIQLTFELATDMAVILFLGLVRTKVYSIVVLHLMDVMREECLIESDQPFSWRSLTSAVAWTWMLRPLLFWRWKWRGTDASPATRGQRYQHPERGHEDLYGTHSTDSDVTASTDGDGNGSDDVGAVGSGGVSSGDVNATPSWRQILRFSIRQLAHAAMLTGMAYTFVIRVSIQVLPLGDFLFEMCDEDNLV
eukprot:GFYU01020380.1.p1 GENE.GFYU01020380.1~~GFYU01020380.1.p1  ORF type:complete len:340 (+),score=67.68 GFYU01020380.1:79-1020(+)